MNTKQYITLRKEHDLATRNDAMSHDQQLFTIVTLKAKFPHLYQEISKDFETIAPEVFAHDEEETVDFPF